jgi:hypothetical protein
MADERAKQHIDRYRNKLANRGVYDQHFEDLARVHLPQRIGFTSTRVPGDKRTDDLFDGTPMQEARGLANTVGAMVRPDGQDWFFIRTVDDSDQTTDEARDWLADSQDRMRQAFADPKARFRQVTGEADLDLVVFGTAVIFVGEGKNLANLLLQSLHLKDANPDFDEDGNAIGMYRSRMLNVWQAASHFGLAKLSDRVKSLFREEKYNEKVEFLHCVHPRNYGRPDALLAINLPYEDVWIELAEATIVQERGFNEFPFIVPRWDTSSGEDFGRSPGMISLPDANTLQAMGETLLVAGQRAADPPLAVPADGSFNEINTIPGGLAFYDPDTAQKIGRNPFFPLETGANMPLTREMQQDTRNQVGGAFMRQLFNLPQPGDATMTATEVNARLQQFIREAGPVFGRLETDYTAPLVERAFKIMLRANAFLPIPDALAGKSVRFEYESPVKRIREKAEAVSAQAWVTDHVNIAKETMKMDVLDPINFDEYSAFTAEANGLPHKLVNGRQAVAAQRQQRQAAAGAAQKLQMAQQAAETAQTAGSVPGIKQLLENAGRAASNQDRGRPRWRLTQAPTATSGAGSRSATSRFRRRWTA